MCNLAILCVLKIIVLGFFAHLHVNAAYPKPPPHDPGQCTQVGLLGMFGFGFCADGTRGTPCCGHGRCDISCRNCVGGCREMGFYDVDLYEHEQYKGIHWVISISPVGCTNIHDLSPCVNSDDHGCESMNDVVSSINTQGRAIKIYEHVDCKGKSRVIAPETPCRSYLEKCGMNDKVSSLSPVYGVISLDAIDMERDQD